MSFDPVVYNHRYRVLSGGRVDFTSEQWVATKASQSDCCYYCGKPTTKLVIEHRVPLERGGEHTASNVVAACMSCNVKKGRLTEQEYLLLCSSKKQCAECGGDYCAVRRSDYCSKRCREARYEAGRKGRPHRRAVTYAELAIYIRKLEDRLCIAPDNRMVIEKMPRRPHGPRKQPKGDAG